MNERHLRNAKWLLILNNTRRFANLLSKNTLLRLSKVSKSLLVKKERKRKVQKKEKQLAKAQGRSG